MSIYSDTGSYENSNISINPLFENHLNDNNINSSEVSSISVSDDSSWEDTDSDNSNSISENNEDNEDDNEYDNEYDYELPKEVIEKYLKFGSDSLPNEPPQIRKCCFVCKEPLTEFLSQYYKFNILWEETMNECNQRIFVEKIYNKIKETKIIEHNNISKNNNVIKIIQKIEQDKIRLYSNYIDIGKLLYENKVNDKELELIKNITNKPDRTIRFINRLFKLSQSFTLENISLSKIKSFIRDTHNDCIDMLVELAISD